MEAGGGDDRGVGHVLKRGPARDKDKRLIRESGGKKRQSGRYKGHERIQETQGTPQGNTKQEEHRGMKLLSPCHR